METVQLKPYYALDETARVDFLTYRVVEIKDPAGEDRRAEQRPESARLLDAPHAARSDLEEREAHRILYEARRELRRQRRPRPWPLEESGWQCFLYPLRLWRGILRLSLLWALTMPVLLLVTALATPDSADVALWLMCAPFLAIPFTLLGITWNFLRQVLRLGVLGDRQRRVGLCHDFRAIVQSGYMASAGLLAGPIFLIVAAVAFWVQAGQLEWLDHLLLWQLGLCAAVAWVYLLLAIDARGRLRDAHAGAVVSLVRRQGWPGLVFPLLGGASLTLFVFLSIKTWMRLFDEGLSALVLNFFLLGVGLFFWTGLMRWYGLTRHWRSQVHPNS